MAKPKTRKAPRTRQGFEKTRGVILNVIIMFISPKNRCQAKSLIADIGICFDLMMFRFQLMAGSINIQPEACHE